MAEAWDSIQHERMQELLRKERVLDALEAAGVDNWEGYSYAFEGFED